MNLIQISIKRPVMMTMVIGALVGLGGFCYFMLSKELFPKIESPIVTVMTRYEGAAPAEVEQLISRELEDEISTVEGIKHLHSISMQGMSVVMAEFYLEVDQDVAAADVRAKVDLVRDILPDSADDPIVQKFDFNAQPVMQLAISAKRSLREVYHTADQRIKDRIATVPDVASVTIVGGEEREIHILTDQQRLRSYGMSITDVVSAVAAGNLETPGGHIQQNSREYNIRLLGKFADLDQIRNLRVTSRTGKTIYLREVAEVKDLYRDIRDKVRADGLTCVGMSIQKQADGNTVAIDREVRKQIEQLKKVLPPDYEITVQDEAASWITSSLDNVFSNMKTGIVLTAITLFLFLHSFRSTLIVSVVMPISVVLSFFIMYITGFTMNMMSMMGLAMTIGVLVDNSVLVIENIVRYLHLGHNQKEAAEKGAVNIAMGVAASTLTNIVIFVPIAFMGGIIGQFFKDLGMAAVISTVASLTVAFTLTPMLASKLLTRENTEPTGASRLGRFGRRFDKGLQGVKDGYANILLWCLRHRAWTLIIAFLVFAASLVQFPFIGGEFITKMDQGKFVLSLEMPTGTRLEETDAALHRIEDLLRNPQHLPELVSLYTQIGRVTGAGMGGATQAVNIGQINVNLTAKEDREQGVEDIINRLRPVLAAANIPGAKIKLLQESGGGGAEAAIQLDVMGDDIQRVRTLAARAMALLNDPEKIRGAIDVDMNYREGQPEIHVIPDREKCRDRGIDAAYLAQVVMGSFEGLIVNEYRDGAYNYDIRVRNSEQTRRTVEDVRELTVMNAAGHLIPLPEVATIEVTTGPSQLFRKDRQSLVTVTCDVSGISPGEVAKAIQRELEPIVETEFPDCHFAFGGQIEHMQESFMRLGRAMVMAVFLTYMLLAAMLESFVEPLMIMISLPLSLIGVLTSLFLMGGTFSIFSMMSIVVLIGMVINNAIIVLNYVNELRKEGVHRTEAFVTAGTTRLRPMLMTNLTTIVALIPLAMGLGWGGELQSSLGMVQIGGLIAGGWLGLLVVPVIYTLWDDFAIACKRRFLHAKKPAPQPAPELPRG